MRLEKLSPAPGLRKKRKRVGRGNASGHGTYSGRGQKGQKSRSGNKMRPGFEGGQMPLIKRLPQKRGFVNIFRQEYNTVNLSQLNIFAPGSEVTPAKLVEAGILKSLKYPIKVLGDGELAHPLVVRANRFSAKAKSKIEATGGKAEEVSDETKAE